MAIDLNKIMTAINGNVPYNYTVGGKSTTTNNGIPVSVRLSMDPDFKQTVLTSVKWISGGIGLGILAGIVIAEARKKSR